MRYSFLICLSLLFGCGKKEAAVKAPGCKLASISRYGDIYPITYNGSKIVKVGDNPSGNSALAYDNSGRLSTIEVPATNPTYKTELYYDIAGRISLEKNYEKRSENWVENTVLFYTYTNEKVTAIRETVQLTSPSLEFQHEVIWEGENIRRINIRSGSNVVCSQEYEYDLTKKNPMTTFIDLYYADFLMPSYKRALYYSANMLVKENNNCPSAQTTNLTYDLSDSLHQKIYTNGGEFLAFNYECH